MTKRHEFQPGLYLAIGLVMLSSICMRIQAQSVPGFVSINCGSNTQYNDTVTQFLWESDEGYISTGKNAEVSVVDNSSDNSEALKTFRYFPDQRAKYCYELNLTTSNVSVLLRAMFLHGNSSILSNLPITFDVYVNSTLMYTVGYNLYATSEILNTPIVIEGIFPCPGSMIYFCLVPQKGTPFISSLELRQLDPDGLMYDLSIWSPYSVWPGVWLFKLLRLNCGAPPNSTSVRYPDDKYDRLWSPPPQDNTLQGFALATGTSSATSSSAVNNVPPTVMQDAWVNDTANSSFGYSYFVGNEYSTLDYAYIAVYTEEIQSNNSGDRIFSALVNEYNERYLSPSEITVSSDPQLFSRDEVYFLNTTLYFTFEADPSSLLGPIVNAIEAYAVYNSVNGSTLPHDVDVLADLQNSFNLTGWGGDPCEPVSWNWLVCTATSSLDGTGSYVYVARVTKLLLSSYGINSTIPSSISQLDELTEIHLDNNSFYGTIPVSLASIQNLTLLVLDDNDLSGEVPQILEAKLGSNLSYSGNTFLTAFSPNGAPTEAPNAAPSNAPNARNATPQAPLPTNKKKSSNIGIVIGAVAGGVLGLAVLLVIILYYFRKSCFRESTTVTPGFIEPPLKVVGNAVGYISYEVIRIATNDFQTKIGQGAYGSVYYGRLHDRDVAVKLNSIQSNQGHDEFMNEVDILTRVHHRNLVSLLGYCNEGKELILIYEYQVNGTLREWLHDEKKTRGTLDWGMRLRIAADGAKGLEYLHKGCNPSIIHRDVKSSNILLDDTLTAKVADFGLSKISPEENSSGLSTHVKGTPGYLDPDYHNLGRLTHKSDVYSYGVVIAELITGRPPLILNNSTGSPSFVLLVWLRDLVSTNNIHALADKSLGCNYNPESMWIMADIALSCVDSVVGDRPDFSQVVQRIHEAIKVETGVGGERFSFSKIIQGTKSTAFKDSSNSTGMSSLDIDSSSTFENPIVERSNYFSLRSSARYANLN